MLNFAAQTISLTINFQSNEKQRLQNSGIDRELQQQRRKRRNLRICGVGETRSPERPKLLPVVIR